MDAISVTQAARMLGVTRQRILALVKQGRIPAQRLEGSDVYLIDRQDFFKFIRTRGQRHVGRPAAKQ